jgi:hypothetical protein
VLLLHMANVEKPDSYYDRAELDQMDERARELERAYVDGQRSGLRLASRRVRARELDAALVQQLQINLRFFARRDVLNKVYPGDEDVIICEGDSWFDHPFLQDISTQLFSAFRYCVLHSNQPGKLLRDSVSEPEFLIPLKDFRKPQIKALLLSSGGNDLINWRKTGAFSPIFKPATSSNPGDFIDFTQLTNALHELTSYFDQVTRLLQSVGAGKLPVLVHCYDHIRPASYEHSLFKGSWIEPQLEAIKASPDLYSAIAGQLQERWTASYREFCANHGWHFIDASGIVRDRWYDEIHPHSRPFYEIASRFKDVLTALEIQPTKHLRPMPPL